MGRLFIVQNYPFFRSLRVLTLLLLKPNEDVIFMQMTKCEADALRTTPQLAAFIYHLARHSPSSILQP